MSAVTDEPLFRVMGLHALEYCERLFYLEEIEEIRVASKAVYDGRRFHEQVPEYSSITSYTIESETLGIYGKVDCVRSEKGTYIPYEYKKGRSRTLPNGGAAAWPSDEVQISAYTMLLEEHLGVEIQHARVYYAADHRTAHVTIDQAMRARVSLLVQKARTLRMATTRPPIATNDRLCARCSLAPVCLPEEERFIENSARSPIRLFPEDKELLNLHITKPGSTIRRSGYSLVVEGKDESINQLPMEQIGSVTIHGHSQITTQALHACADKGIYVHWVTGGGKYIGSMTTATGGVQRKLRQYKALTDEETKLSLAKKLMHAKMEAQVRYVLRLTRGTSNRAEAVRSIAEMRNAIKKIDNVPSADELRGFEGMCSKAYFRAFRLLTADQNESGMAFDHRNKRPPKDPANALLSFLYSLLYRDCVQAIVTVGLDPTIGFYHRPRSAAYPLALDIMEMFRVLICDMTVIGSIHRNQWDAEEDFDRAKEQVWLNDQGRKKAIELYERRKQDKWKHPVIGYSLSYERAIELEVRLLEKEWCGQPGLFAQNQIR